MCTKKVKEESAPAKARKTRLSKKSVNELIDIILRKDDVDKNQKAKIENQKKYIDSLETLNSTLRKEKQLITEDKISVVNANVGLERHLNQVVEECNELSLKVTKFKLLTGIVALTIFTLMLVLIL